jgi:hypothetical protein
MPHTAMFNFRMSSAENSFVSECLRMEAPEDGPELLSSSLDVSLDVCDSYSSQTKVCDNLDSKSTFTGHKKMLP